MNVVGMPNESFGPALLRLITVFHEIVVNPKVIEGWTWPGQGAGRTSHFHLIKAAR